MYSFPLTSWITLQGASSVTSITQSEAQWLDLRGFEDFVAWLEVKQATVPTGSTHVTLTYLTSPTKDEVLFLPVLLAGGTVASVVLDTVAGSNPPVAITSATKENAVRPLARWLRFQLSVDGTPSTSWNATFRIWVAANIGATPKQLRGRMPAPPVRQNGKSCSCDSKTGGSPPIAPSPGTGASLAGGPSTAMGRRGVPASAPMPVPSLRGPGTPIY